MWRRARNLFRTQVSAVNPANLLKPQAMICKAAQWVCDNRLAKRGFGEGIYGAEGAGRFDPSLGPQATRDLGQFADTYLVTLPIKCQRKTSATSFLLGVCYAEAILEKHWLGRDDE